MKTLDLTGRWQLGYSDGERGRPEYATEEKIDENRYFEATVPGCVHQDMMAAGLIGDPCESLNALAARWVEECIWSYRREFEATPDRLEGRTWLVLEQLDLNAVIYLNGEKIGDHHSVFYPCRLEVTGLLRGGTNWITIQIESGIIGAGDKPAQGLGGTQSAYDYAKFLHKSHWLRKPAFQFGWDWSTRLANVGITGRVWLENTTLPLRLDRLVPFVEVEDNLKEATLTLRATVENLSAEPLQISLSASIEELGFTLTEDMQVRPGQHTLECQTKLQDFELWWPVGTGEAKCYTLGVSLQHNENTYQFNDKRIGFRHVRINQEPHPKGGNYCIVEVNHRRIFLKGACWVPADMLMARIDNIRYDALIDRALEANFNFLRIWGGGLYESDHFYARCDELGILVWQEFAFACRQYPLTDRALHDNASTEARYQIRRLAEHPSLIIWCGNNEMEWGNWEWPGFNREYVLPDYGFFHHTLPRLMQEEDPTRYYQPSSPFSSGGASANLNDRGDQHNWSVGLESSDYRRFREMDCRLINESGYLGPTALPTMQACWSQGVTPKIGDFSWRQHDNSVDSWHNPSLPDTGFEEHLGRDIKSLELDDYVYLGGLLHGEALATFADNFRRRAYDSSAACFWMYNDCWPCTRSWTIVDYYVRRTPAFWAVKRAFAALHVALSYSEDQKAIQVHGINDTNADIEGNLQYGICTFQGEYRDPMESTVQLPANTSTLLASIPIESPLETATDRLPFALLQNKAKKETVARNRYLGPRLSELELAPSQIQVELQDGQAIFTSPVVELGVCLDLEGETALPDNFFDLYPDRPYRIPWPQTTGPTILATLNQHLQQADVSPV